jgi:hypothetical protein
MTALAVTAAEPSRCRIPRTDPHTAWRPPMTAAAANRLLPPRAHHVRRHRPRVPRHYGPVRVDQGPSAVENLFRHSLTTNVADPTPTLDAGGSPALPTVVDRVASTRAFRGGHPTPGGFR